ncbi:MAG: GFA family protein [Myxococcota bacterium]
MNGPIHSGRCHCGQVDVTLRGPLPPPSMCHCRACQRRTGSVFGVQVRVPKERFSVRGEVATFTRRGEGEVCFRFCPGCGSTVWWTLDGFPDSVSVAVGILAGTPIPAPTFSVYEERMQPWVPLPESIETHWD